VARFRIIKLLGEGGMGQVFLAERDGRKFALKFLNPRLGKESLGFFQGEVRLLSRLSHPNLVKIHDFFPASATTFEIPQDQEFRAYSHTWTKSPLFSMEYLPGDSLEKKTNAKLEEMLAWFAQILQGLQYLHARNILHRDLKPSNIHILPSGQAKILDFNLSIALQAKGSPSPAIGTIPYMPPEAFQGDYGPESDLFSLGALFYHLISGKTPFTKPLLHLDPQHRHPIDLVELRPEIPEFFSELIHRLLDFSPTRRPASALSVLKYLNQHLESPINLQSEGMVQVVLEKTPLVGREEAWKRLSSMETRGNDASTPALVEVSGPMGIGRSRFLTEWKWHTQLSGRIFYNMGPSRSDLWLHELHEASALASSPKKEADPLSLIREILKNSAKKKLTLAFTDLHAWPENSLPNLQLFLKLVSKSKLPWLLLLEYRSDPGPGQRQDWSKAWESKALRESIVLQDLNSELSLALIAQANPDLPISKAKSQDILRRASGRPLLLLEELRMALEENLGLTPKTLSDAGPSTLQKFASERIRNLSSLGQDVLSLLVTHGGILNSADLEESGTFPLAALQETILELDEKGILSPRSLGSPGLRLAHPSLQDFFLRALPEEKNQKSHLTWIEFFLERSANNPDNKEIIHALAVHAWSAKDIPTFKIWGLKSAEILFLEGPPFQALSWFERLLPLAKGPEERYILYGYLSILHFRLGDFDQALEAYELWYRDRVDDESRLQRIKLLYHTGLILFTAGRDEEACVRLKECLSIGNPEKYPLHRPYLARAHCTLASILDKSWDVEQARLHLQAALDLGQDNPLLTGEVEQLLGSLEQKVLRYDIARDHFKRSLEFYRLANNAQAEAIAHHLLGMLFRECGDLTQAMGFLRTSCELSLRCGEIMQWARYTENTAQAFMDRAEYSEALRMMEEAEEVLALWAQKEDQERMEVNRALLHLYLGNWERSGKILRQLKKEISEGASADMKFYTAYLQGEAHYLQRNYPEALAQFEASLKVSDPLRIGLPSLSAEMSILRCQARLSRLTEEPRLSQVLRRLAILEFPYFKLWQSVFTFLSKSSEDISEKDISSLIQQLLDYPNPEIRIDILELLALDMRKRKLKAPLDWALNKRKEELEKILKSLAEENKIDFDKNRKIDLD